MRPNRVASFGAVSVVAAVAVAVGLFLTGGRSSGANASGWIGTEVVEISQNMTLQENGRVVGDGRVHRIYRVTQVNGEWLYLEAKGARGWAQANQVVALNQAVAYFTQVIRNFPNDASGYISRSQIEFDFGWYVQCLTDLYIAKYVDPRGSYSEYSTNNLAWVMATCPNNEMRMGRQSLRFATEINARSGYRNAPQLDTLAAANAELGNFAEAVRWEQQAVALAPGDGDMRARLNLYLQNRPYREGPGAVLSPADRQEIDRIFADFGIERFAVIEPSPPEPRRSNNDDLRRKLMDKLKETVNGQVERLAARRGETTSPAR